MRFGAWIGEHIGKKFLLISFIHWFLSFFFEKNCFIHSTLESKTFTVAKIIVIFSFWQVVAYMVRRYRVEPDYRRFIRFAAGYFAFSMVLLLFTWPGNWVGDDLVVFGKAAQFTHFAWQHYLTSVFFCYALLLIPTPVAVVILQLACVSLIVGYFVNAIYQATKGSRLAYIAFIPFLLPPVLTQNIYPLRATLFAYLLLLWITCFIWIKKQNKPISYLQLIGLAVLTALVTVIRGEGAYYLIVAPVLFIFVSWGLSSRVQKGLFIVLTCSFVLVLQAPQNKLSGGGDKSVYTLTAILSPLSALVQEAHQQQREDLTQDIDLLLDTSLFIGQLPGVRALSHSNFIKEDYWKAGNKTIIRAYIQLIKQYPRVFFNERWQTFMKTQTPVVTIEGVASFRVENFYEELFEKDPVSGYVDKSVRAKTLNFLALRTSQSTISVLHNVQIPLSILFFTVLVAVMRRQWAAAAAMASILPAAMLVFLTAPTANFMYYFSVYLSGYALFFASVCIALNGLKQRCYKQCRSSSI